MLTLQHVIKITKALVDPTRFRLLQAIAKVRTGSLEGAITIPRGFLEFRVAEHLPQTDTDIVVYCASGARSLLVAQVLRTMGYTRVASMAGGITRWKEAGYPVVRDRLRIPVIPATQSSAKLPRNPEETCHLIQTKAATPSERSDAWVDRVTLQARRSSRLRAVWASTLL